jgi:phospholipase C
MVSLNRRSSLLPKLSSIGVKHADAMANRLWCVASLLTVFALILGCSSTSKPGVPGKVQHIVVIMQENRSFDNLFNGFPGADTVQMGNLHGKIIPLIPVPLESQVGPDHSHVGFWHDWDGGKMDGFDFNYKSHHHRPRFPYSYVPRSETVPLWTLASEYTLGDRMFQSNSGPSFVAHQYMIAGQSGNTSENPNGYPWGCDSAPEVTVALIGPNGTDLPGVFPCLEYQTIADVLDARGITWRYYAPAI